MQEMILEHVEGKKKSKERKDGKSLLSSMEAGNNNSTININIYITGISTPAPFI